MLLQTSKWLTPKPHSPDSTTSSPNRLWKSNVDYWSRFLLLSTITAVLVVKGRACLSIIGVSSLLYIVYSIINSIYNVTFHALAKFPGPKLYGAFYFPRYWHLYIGDTSANMRVLHEKYGPVVRLTPTTLSFNTAQAFRDIYGTQKGIKLPKDTVLYNQMPGSPSDIIIANQADHKRFRRLLSPAFSPTSLRDQEPLIHTYTHLLITQLRHQITQSPSEKIDLVEWLNFTTFDIIGDLALGESFHALENGEYHFWISLIFDGLRALVVCQVGRAYWLIGWLMESALVLVPWAGRVMKEHSEYTRGKVLKRLEGGTERVDFMSHILKGNQASESHMTTEEITANAGVLIIAGSETTATLLSGLIYFLLSSPSSLKKVTEEIRTTFCGQGDMSFEKEKGLRYLQACVEEALRLYPPIPMEMLRVTPREGMSVDGWWVVGNTSVVCPHHATFTASHSFTDPLSFIPERWLGDPKYKNDDLSAVTPFSLGTRNCIGKSLAYAEIRDIMSMILWEFDMELCPESKTWKDQKSFMLWDKPALNVKLSVREGA